ncbi:hypothetical protein, partial [Cobetia amphilecti]|uniref:hypothetical protein n=1 Tax=Cobetia amphilecti TaxID=1055104 RepID=UPI00254B1DBA
VRVGHRQALIPNRPCSLAAGAVLFVRGKSCARKSCAERRPKETPLSLMWQGRFCILGTLVNRDKEKARGVKKSKAAVENSRLGGA